MTAAAAIEPDSLSIWTVTASPSDFPGQYVARRHDVRAGVTPDHRVAATLDAIRAKLPAGMVRVPRSAAMFAA